MLPGRAAPGARPPQGPPYLGGRGRPRLAERRPRSYGDAGSPPLAYPHRPRPSPALLIGSSVSPRCPIEVDHGNAPPSSFADRPMSTAGLAPFPGGCSSFHALANYDSQKPPRRRGGAGRPSLPGRAPAAAACLPAAPGAAPRVRPRHVSWRDGGGGNGRSPAARSGSLPCPVPSPPASPQGASAAAHLGRRPRRAA